MLSRWTSPFVMLLSILAGPGCSSDYLVLYDASMERGDMVEAKSLMNRHIDALSHRDFNPTLPKRVAEAYYRLAYTHGRLAEYDSMRTALNSAVNHDPGLMNNQHRMLEHFEVEEYNKGAVAYNAGDFERSLERLKIALSIIDGEAPHGTCTASILRAMASASIAVGNMRDAIDNCRKASALGDSVAQEMLTTVQNGQTPEPEPGLQPRKSRALSGLP